MPRARADPKSSGSHLAFFHSFNFLKKMAISVTLLGCFSGKAIKQYNHTHSINCVYCVNHISRELPKVFYFINFSCYHRICIPFCLNRKNIINFFCCLTHTAYATCTDFIIIYCSVDGT